MVSVAGAPAVLEGGCYQQAAHDQPQLPESMAAAAAAKLAAVAFPTVAECSAERVRSQNPASTALLLSKQAEVCPSTARSRVSELQILSVHIAAAAAAVLPVVASRHRLPEYPSQDERRWSGCCQRHPRFGPTCDTYASSGFHWTQLTLRMSLAAYMQYSMSMQQLSSSRAPGKKMPTGVACRLRNQRICILSSWATIPVSCDCYTGSPASLVMPGIYGFSLC